jgi:hypothetical protein
VNRPRIIEMRHCAPQRGLPLANPPYRRRVQD